MRQTETPPDVETAGPSMRTLAVIAVGAALAVGAAFFVRPSPQLDTKGSAVVTAAALTRSAPPAEPAPPPASSPPAPVAAEAPAPPREPALSPERQRLARLMSQVAAEPPAAATRSIKIAPAPPPPVVPGVTSFAPAPVQSDAVQALASLGASSTPPATAADEAAKRQMAEAAAKAIRDGDINTARSILQQSLAAGDQAAVMALAETYDPVVLAAMKVENADGDAQKARELYEKASSAGIKEARKRLADLKRYERRH